jgi:Flp pilus assembly protein TadG
MIRPSATLHPLGEPSRFPDGRRRTHKRQGVAITEFAILVPFLGALVLGMYELGRAVMIKDILTNAARKGCRTAVFPGKTYQNVVDDVTNILSDNNITSSLATITIQVATYNGTSTSPSWGSFTTATGNSSFSPSSLDKVSVQVSVNSKEVIWFNKVLIFMPSTEIESETLIMLRQG